jgi:pimeloyl-ACP methyl ester carboxylesterase
MLLDRIAMPLLGRAGARFDEVVVRIAQEMAKRTTRRTQSPADRLAYLTSVGRAYEGVDPNDLFAAPPPMRDARETFVREIEAGGSNGKRRSAGGVSDLTWTSGYVARLPEAREKFARWKENGTAHVRLFRHAHATSSSGSSNVAPPCIVCIHGYRAGTFRFEERAWAAAWLYRLGLDVALFTLPFHALRAPASRKSTPLFPSADVSRTNEGFAQAVWDLRSLVGWLRARGAPKVGVAGMSLGGYTTALAATVDATLDFAIPFIPVADMTDVVVDHEAMRGTTVPRELIEAGKHSMHRVRPLARTPAIPGERVLVVAAENDRIAQRAHAEMLAKHFHAELVTFPGAHLLQFGRREGFSAIAKFLARRGTIAP